MSITGLLKSSLEAQVIDLALRKGYPVLPEGEFAHAEHYLSCSDYRWKNAEAEKHVKGGWGMNPDTKRWFEIPACGWMPGGRLINDDFVPGSGKIELEVSGLSCNCGLYQDMTVRYRATQEKVMDGISRAMKDSLNNLSWMSDGTVGVEPANPVETVFQSHIEPTVMPAH